MSRARMAMLPLLIVLGLLLSACVETVGYGAPVSGYYPAYRYWEGWGDWRHGWDRGRWDGHVEVAHAYGGWGHGFAGHGGFGEHDGGGGHGGGGGGHR
jgi:hypothetical protein